MMTIDRVSTKPYITEIGCSDIAAIANKVKSVDQSFINERGNNVTDECLEYLLPLVSGEVYPEYENGIPKHIFLK